MSSKKYKNISPVWEKKRRKRGKEEERGGDAINIVTILKHAKLWNFFSDGITQSYSWILHRYRQQEKEQLGAMETHKPQCPQQGCGAARLRSLRYSHLYVH